MHVSQWSISGHLYFLLSFFVQISPASNGLPKSAAPGGIGKGRVRYIFLHTLNA